MPLQKRIRDLSMFNYNLLLINYAHRGKRLKSDKNKIKKDGLSGILYSYETKLNIFKEHKAIIHHVAFELYGRSCFVLLDGFFLRDEC